MSLATDSSEGCHPFYWRLNQLLLEHRFDDSVEAQSAEFYAEKIGRPGLPPGIYLRLLLIGYFEGLDTEHGIAWQRPIRSRCAVLWAWVLRARRRTQCLSTAGLVKGKTIGIDATTLEANAAL
jgi:transposase